MNCLGTKEEQEGDTMVIYILLELMDKGSLFDYMEKRQHNRFSEREIITIFRQVAEGIKVMHSMSPPLAHRDLKIENVLYDGMHFKLCDFGSVSSDTVNFS